jgi:DHA1 family inner membrane transport protein
MSWRGAIWFVAALAAIAFAAVAIWLPSVAAPPAIGFRERLAPFTDRTVLPLLATTGLIFAGMYLFQSYVSVVYADATSGNGTMLAVLLFALGVAGIVGNLVTSSWVDRFGARRVLTLVVAALIIDFAVLPLVGGTIAGAAVTGVIYGFTAWSILVPQQHRLITAAPSTAALVVSLNASSVYLAISVGGVLGALTLRTLDARYVTWVALIFFAGGLATSELAHRRTRVRGRA